MSTRLTCPKCQVFNNVKDVQCWKCGRPITDEEKAPILELNAAAQAEENAVKEKDRQGAIDEARKSGDWSSVSKEDTETELSKITLTTSYTLANREIEEELEIISAEVVYGMNIFRDLFAQVRDIVGGRSRAIQKVLREARQEALAELRKEAITLNADAVIAVDLDYQEFSSGGGSGSMLMIVANGTAVRVRK